MSEKDVLKIDVEKVIDNKNPKLRKKLPKFLINYLKKIVHQEELNEFFKESHGKTGLDFVDIILSYYNIGIDAEGVENIPDKGRFVFAANHPIGGIESIAFIKVVSEKYKELKFPVNDILMELKPMASIFIPINKHGGQSKFAIKELEDYFAGNGQILYFPAGMCSRRIKGRIQDPEWKKTFITKAIQHKRDIIPVYIAGRNSNFFYNLSNFRTFARIKTNLEMLYLVDETLRQFNSTIRLKFGKPISYTHFNDSQTHQQWAENLKEIVYQLGGIQLKH